MPDEPSVAGRHETASAPARPRFTDLEGPGCAECAFLREQLDVLVASRGALIEANFALAARANAAEMELGRRALEERRHAEMLLGLADLQRVEAAG